MEKQALVTKKEILSFRKGQIHMLIPSCEEGETIVGRIKDIRFVYPGFRHWLRGVIKARLELSWCVKENTVSKTTALGLETRKKYTLMTKYLVRRSGEGRISYVKRALSHVLEIEVVRNNIYRKDNFLSFKTELGEDCLILHRNHPLATSVKAREK